MRTRSLLVIGVTAIAASLLLGVAGLATGQMAQWSIAAPGGMMGRCRRAKLNPARSATLSRCSN
jgi:hypothetical protein